jgi:hypothetical protein
MDNYDDDDDNDDDDDEYRSSSSCSTLPLIWSAALWIDGW